METSRQEKSMRYLLGKLSERELAEFEAQCFEDDDLFHAVTDLENDLVHSYLCGELSNTEQEEFEKGYLISPARRRKVEFAQALEQNLSRSDDVQFPSEKQQVPPARHTPVYFVFQSRVLHFISIAAAMVATAAIAWLLIINHKLNGKLDQIRAEQAELRRAEQELETKLAAVNARLQAKEQLPETRRPDIVAFNLLPGLSRSGGGIKQLVIPPRIRSIDLNLYLEEDRYPTYRASLETLASKRIWRKVGLKSGADSQGRQIISLTLSPDTLRNGDYVVKLDGVADNGKVEEDVVAYRFTVVRR